MTTPSTDTPNPGSAAALDQGCTCAVYDNARGNWHAIAARGWVITEGCPLHHLVEEDDERG